MRTLCALLLVILIPARAHAACTCSCVGGQMQAICTSTLDIRPPCLGICPIAPPAVRPIAPLGIPPIGTSSCGPEQVLNPYTHRYEWRQICH